MARICLEDLSVVYPLFTRSKGTVTDGADTGLSPTRLVRDKEGRATGVSALNGVSFTVESGERIGILGENGSGKTTLLRVLAGIYPPNTGKVEIEGRMTSLVNINLGMRGEATGHRNITLRGLAAGRSRPEIESRRAEIAAFSELGEFLDLPVETYSSGMKMRLNFAIATAFEPEVLILDEWLSAGDAAFRAKASERMQSFVKKAGVLVLASHSKALLVNNCTRAIWLDAGAVRQDGPINEVVEAYEAEMEVREKTRAKAAAAAPLLAPLMSAEQARPGLAVTLRQWFAGLLGMRR